MGTARSPWLHTQPTIHQSDAMPLDAPLVQRCPPCAGECQQGRACPATREEPLGSRVLIAVLFAAFVALMIFWLPLIAAAVAWWRA